MHRGHSRFLFVGFKRGSWFYCSSCRKRAHFSDSSLERPAYEAIAHFATAVYVNRHSLTRTFNALASENSICTTYQNLKIIICVPSTYNFSIFRKIQFARQLIEKLIILPRILAMIIFIRAERSLIIR